MTIVDERPVRPDEMDPPAPPTLRPDVQDALRREIEQSLQPVLADFRAQSVRAVRQQVDQAQREALEEGRPAPVRDRNGDRGAADGVDEQPHGEPAPSAQRPGDAEGHGPIAQLLEEVGTQWLQSRLESGRDTLCSESVRDRIVGSAEQALLPVVDASLELVPDGAARKVLREEVERDLDELIDDALAELCSERVLTELQQHITRAIRALVDGDVGRTLREVWEAILVALRAFLAAARDQWTRVLHLLVNLVLHGAQEMVGKLLKDGLATVAAVPVEEIEEKAETAKETVKDRAEELRERLAERLESLQGRVKEEVEQVKERVAEGLKSAVDGGAQSDKFGRPPTGRPPSRRPPSSRPPSGRPPSGRPPSGRPPSLTRRDG